MQAVRRFRPLPRPTIAERDRYVVFHIQDPILSLELPHHVGALRTKSLRHQVDRFSPLLRGTTWLTTPSSAAERQDKNRTKLMARAYQQQTQLLRGYATTDLPEHIEVGLPALSPTMEKGNLAKWRKQEGDKITAGDVLAEVETDKATVDFETTDDGYLAKILVPEKTEGLDVGTPIAIIVEEESQIAAFKNYTGKGAAPAPKQEEKKEPAKEEKKSAPAKAEEKPQEAPKPAKKTTPPPPPPSGKVVPGAPPPPAPRAGAASPAARSAAAEQGAKPAAKPASTSSSSAAAQPAGSYTDIPNTQIRKVIAKRLTESKSTIPHYYLTIESNVDQLIKARAHLNAKANGQYKLSVNDFVVKAAAAALRRVPEVNSSWTDEAIRRYHNVDINVAVNTDKGLLTPLIQNADRIGLAAINGQVKALAEKGKEGKLSPAEQASGTFTISNLGMFGIKQFCAVINPPQACILAVGGTEQRVVADGEGKFTTGNFMTVTLSCDHRVVDGAIGARWLQAFKEYLEDPSKLLL